MKPREIRIIKTENNVPVILMSEKAIFIGMLKSCIMKIPSGGNTILMATHNKIIISIILPHFKY